MATRAAHDIPTDPALPLYRLETDIYARLLEAGVLDGAQVGLREGLLVDRRPGGGGALHRLDTDTYNRMVATGALADEPVELLEGLLIEMSRQGPGHYAARIMRLTRYLRAGASVAGSAGSFGGQTGLRAGARPSSDRGRAVLGVPAS